MSKTTTKIIVFLNSLLREPSNISTLHFAKLSIENYQSWEYDEIKRIYHEFGQEFDLENKLILDVGCGLGGKLLFYEEKNAKSVIGFDLRFLSVKSALSLTKKNNSQTIKLLNSNSASMPFPSDTFDVIVSINVFEHVDNLRETLIECKRVIKKDGLIFLHFPPFYSPWGAHLEGWINFPWPHIFFEDAQLLEAADYIEKNKKRNNNYIFSAKVDWSRYSRLPELNRTTISGFLNLISETGLRVKHKSFLPVGRHYFTGFVGAWIVKILKIFTKIPILREVITTKMVFVLTK